jgi:hypothetical protein
MLTHDMRSPLQAIQMTATYLAKINAGSDVSGRRRGLIGSGGRRRCSMTWLISAARTWVGHQRRPVAVDARFVPTAGEIRGSYPDSRVEFSVVGDCRGWWDGKRVQQLLSTWS